MALTFFGNTETVGNLFKANAVGFKRPKAIRFKQGTLSPGAYIDNRKLGSHPDALDAISSAMTRQAGKLRNDFDVIASVATGGISHAAIIAWRLHVPHVIVKKQEKTDHGLGGLVDGDFTILQQARVLLVEDMSSTFKSCLEAMGPLQREGATVAHTILINTWALPEFHKNSEGYSVYALRNGEMLMKYAADRSMIDLEYKKILEHWLLHPEDESWAHDGTWELPKSPT